MFIVDFSFIHGYVGSKQKAERWKLKIVGRYLFICLFAFIAIGIKNEINHCT